MAKSTKSAAQSLLVIALLAAIDSLKNIPAAPVFDAEPVIASLTNAGLPADYVAKAVAEMQRKHEAVHGDSTTKQLDIVLRAIGETEGFSPEDVARIAKLIASGPRKERVVLADAQKEEVKQMRRDGHQPSAIADKYKVSGSTVAALIAGIKPTVNA